MRAGAACYRTVVPAFPICCDKCTQMHIFRRMLANAQMHEHGGGCFGTMHTGQCRCSEMRVSVFSVMFLRRNSVGPLGENTHELCALLLQPTSLEAGALQKS